MFLTDFQCAYEYAKPKYESDILTCLMKPRWGPLWPSAWSAFEPKFRTFPPGGPPLRSPRGSRNRSVIYSPISQHKTKWDPLIGFRPQVLVCNGIASAAGQLSWVAHLQYKASIQYAKQSSLWWYGILLLSKESVLEYPSIATNFNLYARGHLSLGPWHKGVLRQAFLSGTLETSYMGDLMSTLFGNDRCR
jgi:hypothetical protein